MGNGSMKANCKIYKLFGAFVAMPFIEGIPSFYGIASDGQSAHHCAHERRRYSRDQRRVGRVQKAARRGTERFGAFEAGDDVLSKSEFAEVALKLQIGNKENAGLRTRCLRRRQELSWPCQRTGLLLLCPTTKDGRLSN